MPTDGDFLAEAREVKERPAGAIDVLRVVVFSTPDGWLGAAIEYREGVVLADRPHLVEIARLACVYDRSGVLGA